MIHTEKAVRTLQAVAMTVGVAVLLWGTGLPTLFQLAEAASLTNASDTLSSSAPGQSSVHTIAFTTENGMSVNQVFAITFPNEFDLSSLVFADISMTVNGSATSTGDGANGAGIWGITIGDHHIEFEAPSDNPTASSSSFVITIGDEAGTMITNPSATTSYEIGIGNDSATTTIQDSGAVRVAIIDEVTVSASVNTSLTFEVSGVGTGQSVNGTSTSGASTNLALPFGTLDANVIETLAHDLNVTTNATNGYTVTIALSGALESSTGAIIDSFVDGGDTTNPQAWTSPSADINDLSTFGHWGVTSEDATTTRANQFAEGAGTWAGLSTSSPSTNIVMGHTGPADGSTQGIGAARVGYQIEISALQEAGDDYNTELRYIATPTF